ncbi:hypothetical protein D3C85_392770 [compost metagenome]
MKYSSISEFLQNASDEERKKIFEAILKESTESQQEHFNFNLERMKAAVEGPTIQLPSGLSREERRKFIMERIPDRDKSIEANPKPNDLTVEESLVKIYERYEQTFKELDKE